jgi:hypothetical protein
MQVQWHQIRLPQPFAIGSRSWRLQNVRCGLSRRDSSFVEHSSYSNPVESNGTETLPALLTDKKLSASNWEIRPLMRTSSVSMDA